MTMNVTFSENEEVLGQTFEEFQAVTTLDSPAFTGTPTAPTAEVNNNSTQLATTEFVKRAISLAHMGYGNIVYLTVETVTS